MKVDPQQKRCIGYGDQAGRCEDVVDTSCSVLWCARCERLRRETITK